MASQFLLTLPTSQFANSHFVSLCLQMCIISPTYGLERLSTFLVACTHKFLPLAC